MKTKEVWIQLWPSMTLRNPLGSDFSFKITSCTRSLLIESMTYAETVPNCFISCQKNYGSSLYLVISRKKSSRYLGGQSVSLLNQLKQ